MTSLTYTTLKDAIYAFTEDNSDELVANIDIVIGNGLEAVVRDLDLDIFNEVGEGTLTSSSNALNKPTGYLIMKSISYIDTTDSNKRKFLRQRSQDYCEIYAPSSSSTGKPKYYSDEKDTAIYIAPAPNLGYAYKMRYVKRPALNSVTTTNWISANVGDLLLYACLIQAERFLMATEKRTGKWEEPYMAQLAQARKEFDSIRRKDDAPLRETSYPQSEAEARSS